MLLKDRILKADTVAAIDCRDKQGYLVIDPALISDTNNSDIFQKGKILTVGQIKRLAKIVSRPDSIKGRFTVDKQFTPAQIVVLISNHKRSLIQISSRQIKPSNDRGIAQFFIDVRKELDLDNFFYNLGLNRQD
jgi:hypothetical protein